MKLKEYLQGAKTATLESIKTPCRAEIKYDGVRLTFLDNKVYTRNDKLVNLPLTVRAMPTYGIMLDCEVTLCSGKMEDRGAVSGMINSAMKGGTIDESLLRFRVFDMMLAGVFEQRLVIDSLKDRIHKLKTFLSSMNNEQFIPAVHMDCRNSEQLKQFYDRTIEDGYEGLVIKYYDDMYKFGKRAWPRIKEVRTADLLCVDAVDGNGKYSGMIGSLMLEGMVDDKPILVSVGSGMTDEDRGRDPNYYIDQTIEIKYSHVTKDKKTGEYSLNQPRYSCRRIDK